MAGLVWSSRQTVEIDVAGCDLLSGAGHAEENGEAEDFFEEGAVLLEGEHFERKVFDERDGDDETIAVALDDQLVNSLAAGFIESVGNAQKRGHLGDGDPLVAVERGIAFVRRLRRGPAMIAGDEGGQEQVLLAQAKQLAV